MQLLKISENQRFIVQDDGKPFFWLADTAWELFHKLDKEEATRYLEKRAEQGFNVIQAVALAEFDGIRSPNKYGRIPFKNNSQGEYDPTLPDLDGEYSYWDHVDFIVSKAEDLGLYIAMLPTWGDKFNKGFGQGPEFFTPENARVYGEFIAKRYQDKTNIIWVMGGDRPLEKAIHFEIVNSMANAIKAVTKDKFLMTFHPYGNSSSSKCVHDEEWLDFNMIQSGHMEEFIDMDDYITKDYNLTPVKPVLDGESRYEDHPMAFTANNVTFDDFICRVAGYESVFAGGCGYTYGHHSIWSMTREDSRWNYFVDTWETALDRPGANQMHFLKDFMLSKSFGDFVPDCSMFVDRYDRAAKLYALKSDKEIMVYDALGLKFSVKMGILKGDKVKLSFFYPKTGETEEIGLIDNKDEYTVITKVSGRGCDVVVIFEEV